MKSDKTLIKRFAPLIVILAILVALVAVLSTTRAYYILTGGESTNEYTPAEPADPSFTLDVDTQEKKENVRITVEDNGYPVYVRVAIVITWQKIGECSDPAGCGDCSECPCPDCPKCYPEVYYEDPVKDTDYTILLNNTDWKQHGYFYYYTSPVASGGTTAALIYSCALIDGTVAPEEGYVLSVEIIAQTVQAIGSTDQDNTPAWQDAWGIR